LVDGIDEAMGELIAALRKISKLLNQQHTKEHIHRKGLTIKNNFFIVFSPNFSSLSLKKVILAPKA
jgi:hypothetical protein